MTNISLSPAEIKTMRSECYRHWLTQHGSNLEEMAWDLNAVDWFPTYGWAHAEDELVAEYYIKFVKPVQPGGN